MGQSTEFNSCTAPTPLRGDDRPPPRDLGVDQVRSAEAEAVL
jgi:hypothetical protein